MAAVSAREPVMTWVIDDKLVVDGAISPCCK
jgi:hypothetical protein